MIELVDLVESEELIKDRCIIDNHYQLIQEIKKGTRLEKIFLNNIKSLKGIFVNLPERFLTTDYFKGLSYWDVEYIEDISFLFTGLKPNETIEIDISNWYAPRLKYAERFFENNPYIVLKNFRGSFIYNKISELGI